MHYPVSFSRQLREHLRGLRVQRGLTQNELGKRLGLGQARIAEIESKPGAISVDQLLQILSVLGGGLLVDDGMAAVRQVQAAPLEKPPEKPTRSRGSSPVKKYDERKLSSGTKFLTRADGAAGTKQDMDELQTANPHSDVAPTSKRNFVIRPKKGSW